MAYTSNPDSFQVFKSLRDRIFQKLPPFLPAVPCIQAELAMVLSVVLNIITYTSYEGLWE